MSNAIAASGNTTTDVVSQGDAPQEQCLIERLPPEVWARIVAYASLFGRGDTVTNLVCAAQHREGREIRPVGVIFNAVIAWRNTVAQNSGLAEHLGGRRWHALPLMGTSFETHIGWLSTHSRRESTSEMTHRFNSRVTQLILTGDIAGLSGELGSGTPPVGSRAMSLQSAMGALAERFSATQDEAEIDSLLRVVSTWATVGNFHCSVEIPLPLQRASLIPLYREFSITPEPLRFVNDLWDVIERIRGGDRTKITDPSRFIIGAPGFFSLEQRVAAVRRKLQGDDPFDTWILLAMQDQSFRDALCTNVFGRTVPPHQFASRLIQKFPNIDSDSEAAFYAYGIVHDLPHYLPINYFQTLERSPGQLLELFCCLDRLNCSEEKYRDVIWQLNFTSPITVAQSTVAEMMRNRAHYFFDWLLAHASSMQGEYDEASPYEVAEEDLEMLPTALKLCSRSRVRQPFDFDMPPLLDGGLELFHHYSCYPQFLNWIDMAQVALRHDEEAIGGYCYDVALGQYVHQKNLAAISRLIEAGGAIYGTYFAPDRRLTSPLEEAIRSGDRVIVAHLLSKGSNDNPQPAEYREPASHPITLAIKAGRRDLVQLFADRPLPFAWSRLEAQARHANQLGIAQFCRQQARKLDSSGKENKRQKTQ